MVTIRIKLYLLSINKKHRLNGRRQRFNKSKIITKHSRKRYNFYRLETVYITLIKMGQKTNRKL